MKKGHMMELIQRLIHDAAVEQLRKKRKASPHDPPKMTEDELDKIIFDGNMDTDVRSMRMSESFDSLAKISPSDITEFERQMNDMVATVPNAILSFDKQKNGYSIMLKNGQPISVVASGKVTFGSEGELIWMFSIPNGFRVQTEDLEVTQVNRDLVSNMSNYYDVWQKDWRQKLLSPASEEGQAPDGGPDKFRGNGGVDQMGGTVGANGAAPQQAPDAGGAQMPQA